MLAPVRQQQSRYAGVSARVGSGWTPQRTARRSWSVTRRPPTITAQYWTMCGSPKLTLQRVTRMERYVLASR